MKYIIQRKFFRNPKRKKIKNVNNLINIQIQFISDPKELKYFLWIELYNFYDFMVKNQYIYIYICIYS